MAEDRRGKLTVFLCAAPGLGRIYATLPRSRVEQRGGVLEEFDLDSALTRRPRIVLVDKLAHSNPEASRHSKRHQKIERDPTRPTIVRTEPGVGYRLVVDPEA